MKKEEFIRRYGIATYEKKVLQQSRDWKKAHPKERKAEHDNWILCNPEKVRAQSQQQCRKGGRRYEQTLKYNSTGLRHLRRLIRTKHQGRWRSYKNIIAPESQLHHQWIPETANYTGVALVEKDQHMHGYIDIIQILEGEITLLTEEVVRVGGN